MDLQKIGSFLKELRKEKELTQEQLAETLNVSRSLANKSQALKQDFFGEKDGYGKQTTTREAKKRSRMVCKIRN